MEGLKDFDGHRFLDFFEAISWVASQASGTSVDKMCIAPLSNVTQPMISDPVGLSFLNSPPGAFRRHLNILSHVPLPQVSNDPMTLTEIRPVSVSRKDRVR